MRAREFDVDLINRYEEGLLSDAETVVMFQKLVDCSLIGQMRGHYMRMAEALKRAGFITGTII